MLAAVNHLAGRCFALARSSRVVCKHLPCSLRAGFLLHRCLASGGYTPSPYIQRLTPFHAAACCDAALALACTRQTTTRCNTISPPLTILAPLHRTYAGKAPTLRALATMRLLYARVARATFSSPGLPPQFAIQRAFRLYLAGGRDTTTRVAALTAGAHSHRGVSSEKRGKTPMPHCMVKHHFSCRVLHRTCHSSPIFGCRARSLRKYFIAGFGYSPPLLLFALGSLYAPAALVPSSPLKYGHWPPRHARWFWQNYTTAHSTTTPHLLARACWSRR